GFAPNRVLPWLAGYLWTSRRARTSGSEENLPSDEELMADFNARLPPKVRIYKERALKAEETLRKADQSIKALGIDLEKDDREKEELSQILPPLSLEAVALCWPSQGGEGKVPLLTALHGVLDEIHLFELESLPKLATE
ncbi:unnamed protein product, partial [Durusdinium trenchii]